MPPASASEIGVWFDEGVEQGATHMLVMVDTFAWDDYPVFIEPGQNVRQIAGEHNGKKLQRLMEVYVLEPTRKSEQMSERRAFHYEMPGAS